MPTASWLFPRKRGSSPLRWGRCCLREGTPLNSSDTSRLLAVAVDLGTTTIASSLLDTVSGVVLAREGSLNPQRPFGADVVSRLEYACRGEAERHTLSRLVNAELERLVESLLYQTGMAKAAVTQVAIAANPTMSHLLLD